MKQFKSVWLKILLGVLTGMLVVSSAAFAESDRLYGEVGAGLIIFNPPNKDSVPFYETDWAPTAVGGNGRIMSPLDFNPQDYQVAANLLLGYRLGKPDAAGFWGSNFRVEFSSNFYFPEYSDTTILPMPPNIPGGGSVVWGIFYSDAGMVAAAPLGGLNNTAPPGTEAVPPIKLKADFDYFDFTLKARSDYPLLEDKITLSPYVGVPLAFLYQDFSYTTRTAAVPGIGGPYNYRAEEELDTWYTGVVLGADIVFSVTKGLTFSLGASFAPLYSHTDMDLAFSGDPYNPAGLPISSLSTNVGDDDSTWTFRAIGNAELKYRIKWFAVSLSGMLDYWDDMPVVEYPYYSVGEWIAIAPATYPNKVPEIDGKSALNYGAMLKFTFYLL